MKKIMAMAIFIGAFLSSLGQSTEIEAWREEGFKARMEQDYEAAIGYYNKILSVSPDDYDARLSVGRLYLLTEDYQGSIDVFSEIYREDSTDVEAMNGLGACYSMTGDDRLAVYFYEKAFFYYKEDIEQYFRLAAAYGNGGEIDKAIGIYNEAMAIDSTYSEIWAGIGKMYYWKGKPATSMDYYERALELDPENEDLKKEYNAVKTEMDFGLSVSFGPVNEKEENYEINAMISRIGFEKRLSDHFHIQAGFLLDYSNRTYSDDTGDTTRWYDNLRAKGSWISQHHTLSAIAGYSSTDNKFSSYGLVWKLNYNPGKFIVKNTLGAGYDYFYYWNKVGSSSIADEFLVSIDRLGFEARYNAGLVDEVTVIDYTAEGETFTSTNPYQSYGLSVNYKVLRKPAIRLGINHSYLDYKYKSPLYYSPHSRFLTGASASIYYNLSRFFVYGSFAYNAGTEKNYEEDENGNMKEVGMNVNNWSANLELGYDFYPFSFSIGGNNFYNPYYQSLTGFMNLKILF